jgi:uncharacterized protein YecE (DUF72 family)
VSELSGDRGRILVGTAAWSDHEHFYPPGVRGSDRITYYARHFPVVEVNASYYALLPEKNYATWVDKTPDDFTFNVKALGQLTGHVRHEPPTPETLDAFRSTYAPLRQAGKLGAVLFQYPPWFENSQENREKIAWCAEMMADDPLLVEFRNRSWLTEDAREDTLEMLRSLRLSYVTVDAPQVGSGTAPLVPAVTRPELAYLRMHGRNTETWYKRVKTTGERFNYHYSDDELTGLAQVARQLAENALEVHVMFNNNMSNYAVENARTMMNLLGLAPPEENPQQARLDI